MPILTVKISFHPVAGTLCIPLIIDLSKYVQNLVYKIFEGERSPELLQKTRDCFEKAKPYKPAASRGDSVEIFVVGHGFIPEAAPAMPPEPKRGPPAPGPGWGR